MADNIGKVTATSDANEFQTKNGKSGLNFKAEKDGQRIYCTVWGGSYGPTNGTIMAGDVITAKMTQKGEYNGTTQYWITPTAVERAGQPSSQEPEAAPPQVSGSRPTPQKLDYEKTAQIFSRFMLTAKAVCDNAYPDASADSRLESCEKIAIAFFIGWQQGRVPAPTFEAGENNESDDDMNQLITGIVENMKSKGAM